MSAGAGLDQRQRVPASAGDQPADDLGRRPGGQEGGRRRGVEPGQGERRGSRRGRCRAARPAGVGAQATASSANRRAANSTAAAVARIEPKWRSSTSRSTGSASAATTSRARVPPAGDRASADPDGPHPTAASSARRCGVGTAFEVVADGRDELEEAGVLEPRLRLHPADAEPPEPGGRRLGRVEQGRLAHARLTDHDQGTGPTPQHAVDEPGDVRERCVAANHGPFRPHLGGFPEASLAGTG